MAVITRFPLCLWPARAPQPWHADARSDQPPGVRIRHQRIGENVEHLIEQPRTAMDLDLRSLPDPLGQLVPGTEVSTGNA